MNETPTYALAEKLRNAQNYEEASQQFEQLWQNTPNAYNGWRYAFCLRKLARLKESEKAIREALAKFPNDKYTKSEMGWLLYEKVKAAQVENDLGRAMQIAREILALNLDGLIIQRVTTIMMKVAKGQGKWEIVLEWSDKVTPAQLSNTPPMINGRPGMSDREIWYLGKARALLETGRWAEAREFARAGLVEFPKEFFLGRIAALAADKLGNLDEAAQEMHQLLTHPRVGWYFKAELAEVEEKRGNHQEAYRYLCEALSNSQIDEFKLGCYVTMGRIALKIGQNQVAADHAALAKTLRSNKNWSIPAELAQLEQAVMAAYKGLDQSPPPLPNQMNELVKRCQQVWQEGKTIGLNFLSGTLGAIDPQKAFTFIRRDDNGEGVYVLVRDIPKGSLQAGARLEFTLEKSYDQKKKRESVRALHIRSLKG